MSANTPTANSSFDRVEQVVNQFTEATADLARDCNATESVLNEFVESAEALGELVGEIASESSQAVSQANENSDKIEEVESELNEERERRSAEIEGAHNRISSVEQDIDDVNPTPKADDTTTQADDLTPIEQLSQADEIEEVTESKSVQRAVSIFLNIDNWGSRTPKGIILKPADNPLSLLEADQNESLAWKQYYRAAEALEQLSHGSVTFFHSDKHGKVICLHRQSEAYQRVVQGTLSSSSVGAEG